MVHSNCFAHTFRYGLLLSATALLSACAGYAFNINDNPIYNPPSLFSDFRLEDRALDDCVQQTIEDRRVTRAADLTQLNCSSAGITSLEGLETFTGLKAISLASNELETVEELQKLTRLELVYLRDNPLRSVEPLLTLLRLKEVDLRGNEALACGDARQLADNIEGTARLPKHCR